MHMHMHMHMHRAVDTRRAVDVLGVEQESRRAGEVLYYARMLHCNAVSNLRGSTIVLSFSLFIVFSDSRILFFTGAKRRGGSH
jgi:hypothetical protein